MPAILSSMETGGLTAQARPEQVPGVSPPSTKALAACRQELCTQVRALTDFRPAEASDIARVHQERYIQALEATVLKGREFAEARPCHCPPG